MPDESLFRTIEASELRGDVLLNLLCRTAQEKGRVEVSNCGGGSCVIISKDELEALERALEILADGDGLKSVCQSIEHLCDTCRQEQA